MRIMNMVIVGTFALFATTLAIYTAPVGTRTLAQWALCLGLFSSAALTSWLFLIIIYFNPANKTKTQIITLLGYAIAMICSVIAGASFSVVYLLIETTHVNFLAALQRGGITIFIGYGLALIILLLTALFLKKQSTKIIENESA